MTLELRPYQIEALAAIEKALAAGRRPILALPTGAGKTIVAAEKIRAVVRNGGRALFLVHRKELIEQGQATLARMAPDIRIGIVKAEQDEVDAPVVIASIQTAWRSTRLARLGTDFQIAVVDEAHHATATTWRTIIGALHGVPLFGLTATPFRADGAGLIDIFDEVAYQKTIVEMIPEWLCDIRGERIQVQADFNKLHVVGGEIIQGESAQMLLDADAPAEIVAAYKQHAVGRKTLVFTPTIAVAEAVAQTFREAGIAAEAISDASEPDERRGIIARLKSGQTPVVTNCTLLTEGFDCPDVSCIVIARPTKSKVLYVQMIGRGTRKAAGKDDLLVLDTVGASARHDLHTLGALFSMRSGETVLEAAERERIEREAAALAEQERGKLLAQRLGLIRQRTLSWSAAPNCDLFVLSLGKDHGSIRIVRENDRWTVVRQFGADRGYDWLENTGFEDLADATAAAEEILDDKLKQSALVDRNAWWRSAPIEPGSSQVAQATKLRIPYRWGRTTKGQLSDLLSIAFARRSEEYRTGRRRPAPFWATR